MASKLDDLLPAIISAGDSGLSIGKISEKFAGKSKAKESTILVREKLVALVREGAIWVPSGLAKPNTILPMAAAPRSRAQVGLLLASFRSPVSNCFQRRDWKRR
jgi:hypothetical protein